MLPMGHCLCFSLCALADLFFHLIVQLAINSFSLFHNLYKRVFLFPVCNKYGKRSKKVKRSRDFFADNRLDLM